MFLPAHVLKEHLELQNKPQEKQTNKQKREKKGNKFQTENRNHGCFYTQSTVKVNCTVTVKDCC